MFLEKLRSTMEPEELNENFISLYTKLLLKKGKFPEVLAFLEQNEKVFAMRLDW
jgi:hypothetical protein